MNFALYSSRPSSIIDTTRHLDNTARYLNLLTPHCSAYLTAAGNVSNKRHAMQYTVLCAHGVHERPMCWQLLSPSTIPTTQTACQSQFQLTPVAQRSSSSSETFRLYASYVQQSMETAFTGADGTYSNDSRIRPTARRTVFSKDGWSHNRSFCIW